RCYIYFGGSSMDDIADIVLEGEGIDDFFGSSVVAAGDVNSDGYDDIIVSTDRYNNDTGRSYIYFGGDSMDPVADVILNGEDTDNYFGLAVAAVGDINEDGYDDVIIGAHGNDTYSGSAYIYYGGDSMDDIADVILESEGIRHHFGYAVAGAGDVNGEGNVDLIVGALHHPANGAAYIYYGEPSLSLIDIPNDDQQPGSYGFKLKQNYPNPFRPVTAINYEIGLTGSVKIGVYNIAGQCVRALVDQVQGAGNYQIDWDGRNDSGKEVGSGIYFYRLEAAGKSVQKRMVLLR
ncbi:MAG: T9SS type A sorting domain-containing protein, partial [candidate division Zixibacteria bacterium]|nr:T9SS type A sorting domain-containing protein [candidate division Zixibacteria bacterium]